MPFSSRQPNLNSLGSVRYRVPFVSLLFNLFLEDFVMIYYLIFDNLAQQLNYRT